MKTEKQRKDLLERIHQSLSKSTSGKIKCIYIYSRYGERVEAKDDDIHMAAFVPGNQDDVAICKANSKEEAIQKLRVYYPDASKKNVKSLDELYWIPNEDISILTTF